MELDKINRVCIFNGSFPVYENESENIKYDVNNGVLNIHLGNITDEISVTKKIEHDNNRISITALLDESGDSTSVWVDYRKNTDDDFESWDNDEWILGELKSLVNNEIGIENCKYIARDVISPSDYYSIKWLLNKAIELGFFNYMKK